MLLAIMLLCVGVVISTEILLDLHRPVIVRVQSKRKFWQNLNLVKSTEINLMIV